jgi:hypothetical protein
MPAFDTVFPDGSGNVFDQNPARYCNIHDDCEIPISKIIRHTATSMELESAAALIFLQHLLIPG